MLGLCARAGRLVSGEEAVRIAVERAQARIVVADCDMSPGSREKLERLCARGQTPVIYSRDIGRAIGREGRMALAVTDAGFAARLAAIHKEEG